MILISKRFQILDSGSEIDGQLSFVTIKENSLQESLTICNIYLPPQVGGDRIVQAFRKIEDFEGRILLVGDWNCILDPNLDSYRQREMTKKDKVLKEKIVEHALVDLWRVRNPAERRFSWRRIGQTGIQQSRIDFALANMIFNYSVLDIDYGAGIRTDHSFLMISWQLDTESRGPGTFKFNNDLLLDEIFVGRINDLVDAFEWESFSTKQLAWEMFILKVHEVVLERQAEVKRSRRNILQVMSKKIDQKERELSGCLLDQDKLQKWSEDFDRMVEIREEILESKTHQSLIKNKIRWAALGERNTKYFYAKVKNRSPQMIQQNFRGQNGKLLTSNEEVLKHQTDFFEQLYRKNKEIDPSLLNVPDFKLGDLDRKALDALPRAFEVSQSLRKMKNDTCPGVDGITTNFLKFFWGKLKRHFVDVTQEIWSGELIQQNSMLRAVITLIPKANRDLSKVQNWRPISLLTVPYRLITKVLADRIQEILKGIISSNQYGFVKGRHIHQNLLWLESMVQKGIAKPEQDYVLISVDIEKCFDKIDWDALDRTLELLNFGTHVRIFIRNMISLQVCTMARGFTSSYFDMQSGLLQGSPLSPILALLILEPLADRIRQNELIKGIHLSGVERKILQFADDLTGVIQARSLDAFFEEFRQFFFCTGLKISYDKTQVYRLSSLTNAQANKIVKSAVRWVDSPPEGIGFHPGLAF